MQLRYSAQHDITGPIEIVKRWMCWPEFSGEVEAMVVCGSHEYGHWEVQEDPGKPISWFQSMSKDPRRRKVNSLRFKSECESKVRRQMSQLAVMLREIIISSHLFFYPGFQWIGWGTPIQGGQSVLISLQIWMLISSGRTP